MAVAAVRTNGSRRAILAVASIAAMFASLLFATPAPAAVDCSTTPAVLPASQIHAGMTGTGLTTVQGSTPTSFNITVIGTLEDAILPGHDLVIFQITGPQSFLDQAHGMFFGMSGSPIFINGQLAGAASYRFYFSDATIGLFTPAQDMVEIVRPAGPTPAMPTSVSLTPAARPAGAAAAGGPAGGGPGGGAGPGP